MPPDSSEIEYEELFSEELMLIVSRHHTLAEAAEIDVRDLRDLPLLLPNTGFRVRHIMDEHFSKGRISPKILMEINDFPALLTMVKGNNVATIGCSGYLGHDPDINLIPLREGGQPLRISKGLIRAKETPMTAAVRAFIELTKAQLADPAAKPEPESLPAKSSGF